MVAIAVLAVVGYTTYTSVIAHQEFLEQEKKLVEIELSQMITRYDEVASTNEFLSSKLSNAKTATKRSLDSLHLLKSDISVITRFKVQSNDFKIKNQQLLSIADSINNVNTTLQEDKLLAYSELKKQVDANVSLQQQNHSLIKTIEKGALLTANSFKANAYQILDGKPSETRRASKAETIEVCFTLAENALTEKGPKKLYIQILNPKNNVVSDKGFIEFGDSSLIYSNKTVIDYTNDVVDVCANIISETSDRPLDKGIYFISVFHKDRKLGSTQIELK